MSSLSCIYSITPRYDERPVEPMEDSKGDDPFDVPFYPFTDEGPLLNGGPLE